MTAARSSKTAAKTKPAAPAVSPARFLVVGGYPGASAYGVVCALAIEAKQEIHRVDLEALFGLQVEETKRNLTKLFTQAKAKELILFFDEADAVFGKRSEVRDAHDRYVNLQIDALLEKLDKFQGTAVFASNRPTNLDDAIFRRCQQIISIEPPPPRKKPGRG